MREMIIDGRKIGPAHPPYVIAEMSGNHKGELARALALIDAAKAAGADAVKIQSYTADTITIDHDGPEFRIGGGLWEGRTLYDLYQEASTPWDWHEALFAHAREIGITLFSSPFDPTAIDMLERLGTPAFKIASFELIDLPLIQYAARTGKPLIMSTGLATQTEIEEAVAAVREIGDNPILLLHCTSGYPTPVAESDLVTIPYLKTRHGCEIGLSDHTMGTLVPIAAVALGAVAIEKHFTLARADGGVDSAFSLEAHELAELVRSCREAWSALGKVDDAPKPSEGGGRDFRRSLYVVADVATGAVLGPEHVRSIRPGLGLAPKHLPEVLGRRAARDLKRGTPLAWDMLTP
ncbi:MAG TPA: pseudaminic acid synthase [Stellaceae bacterium]|nr:pseudaminic acid synthase [Stellaceae bacterium]